MDSALHNSGIKLDTWAGHKTVLSNVNVTKVKEALKHFGILKYSKN